MLSEKIIDIARKALDAGEIGGVILLKKTAPDSAMHSLVSSSDMLTQTQTHLCHFSLAMWQIS
ncbi:hypothetical protein J7M00_09665 [bacterium]|nr:hypothetical protein [bacterium]